MNRVRCRIAPNASGQSTRVVDDEPTTRASARAAPRLGYAVQIADSGGAAIEILRQTGPAVPQRSRATARRLERAAKNGLGEFVGDLAAMFASTLSDGCRHLQERAAAS